MSVLAEQLMGDAFAALVRGLAREKVPGVRIVSARLEWHVTTDRCLVDVRTFMPDGAPRGAKLPYQSGALLEHHIAAFVVRTIEESWVPGWVG